MLKRQLPEGNFFLELDNYISRSNKKIKSILSNIKENIKSRYVQYIMFSTRLEKLRRTHLTDAEKDAMHAKFSQLRNKEKVDLSLRCPYCQIQHARTLDHFMPKEDFPDFSIFRPNLIWVCGTCNSKKGNNHVLGTRSVLNPYFDNQDLDNLLECCWIIEEEKDLIVRYEVPDRCTHRAADIAKRHLRLFELQENFSAEASNLIDSLCEEIVAEHLQGRGIANAAHQAIKYRLRCLTNTEKDPNHWKRLLWTSAQNQINLICDYVFLPHVYNDYRNKVERDQLF